MRKATAVLFVSMLGLTTSVFAQAGYTPYLDRTYGTHTRQKLDLYVPTRGSAFPVVVFVHGGGWAGDDKILDPVVFPLQTNLVKHLANRGYAVASINYRLAEALPRLNDFAPDPAFPGEIYDVKSAIRWLRDNAITYKLNPSRIGLWGGSAGGHLVLLTAYSDGDPVLTDPAMTISPGYGSYVSAVLSEAGPTDLLNLDDPAHGALRCQINPATPTATPTAPPTPTRVILYIAPTPTSALSNFLGCNMAANCQTQTVANANPINFVKPQNPPTLLMHASVDCAVPPQQSQTLFDALTAAGAPASYIVAPCASDPDTGPGCHSGPVFWSTDFLSHADVFFDQHLQPITWNATGVTTSGNSITGRTSSTPAGWGYAGASSRQALLDGDGFVEFTVDATTTYRVIGLSRDDADLGVNDIDFGIELVADPNNPTQCAIVSENGQVGLVGSQTCQVGDRFRLAVEGTQVKYYKNETWWYTSTKTPAYPLQVDTALLNVDAKITNVLLVGHVGTIEKVAWTSASGVTVAGNKLTKTAATGWGNAGALSQQAILNGTGSVEFIAGPATNGLRAIGLSHGDSDLYYYDIDYGFVVSATNVVSIYENTTGYATGVTAAQGDRLRIAVDNGQVKYYWKTTLLRTSTVTPATYPLQVDTAINTSGGILDNVTITGMLGTVTTVAWAHATQVTTATPNAIAKPTTAPSLGWNAGASSTTAIVEGDGSVEFKVGQPGYRIIGLSRGDTNADYSDIDFAIEFGPSTTAWVTEKGIIQGSGLTYAPGNRFRIAVEKGQVKYYKNEVWLYTSSASPAYPMLVDTSFYDRNVWLSEIFLAGILGSP